MKHFVSGFAAKSTGWALRFSERGARIFQERKKPMETTVRGNHETAEAESRLSAAVERAKEVCQRLQDQTAAAAKATDKVIRDHPYEAIGLALGLGVLTGLLLARSRRS